MGCTFAPLAIPGVMLIAPDVFQDARGFFMEVYKWSEWASHGIQDTFVQDNHSHSSRGVLRGLHFQRPPQAQAKLVRVIQGEIFDVAVDLRQGSPTYGRWVGATLSGENRHMLYVPGGCAHGFCVTSTTADVVYKVSAEYAPETEAGIIWNDPDLAIDWPLACPALSARDARYPRLRDIAPAFFYHDTGQPGTTTTGRETL